jgi:murein DD-endopeptidase MepM/ murein hydrolase activator NlpD
MKKLLCIVLAALMLAGLFGVAASANTQGFTWPVPGFDQVSSGFGWRGRRMHSGIDIAGPGITGATVVAAQSGVVELAEIHRSYGHQVVIDHGNGIRTRYAHLQAGSMSVGRGRRVEMGQAIGRVGRTGNATGPHLHFEVIVNGVAQNPLNFVQQGVCIENPWWYTLPAWLQAVLRWLFFGWLWM